MAEPDRVEAHLRAILDRVDGWLRFAEVKNGGVIALSATVTTALLSALRNVNDLTVPVQGLFTAAMVLFILSMAVGLFSYLPRRRPEQLRAGPAARPTGADNLYFYGDLAHYRPEELAAAVARRYTQDGGYEPAAHPAHLDLAAQVTVNSRITVRKLKLFERGGALALLAAVIYALALVVRQLGY